MSVIGYDGRIRPANRPTTASAPNELKPEMVKGLSEAQPKFVEGVVNLMNVSGKGAVAYGEALEKKRMRMEELDDKMYNVKLQEQADKDLLNILNDDNLTPEQKKKKAEDYALSVEPTGNEERDKRRGIFAAEQSRRVVAGIYKDAMAMQKTKEATSFGASLTVFEAEMSNFITAKTPEILDSVKSINELPEKLEEVLAPEIAKFEENTQMTPQNRLLYEEAKAKWKAAVLTKLGATFNKQSQEKIKDDTRLMISAVSLNAKNVTDAANQTGALLGSPSAGSFFSDREKRELVNGTMEAYSLNKFTEVQTALAADVKAAQKMLTQHLENGNVADYNQGIRLINNKIESTFNLAIGQLEADKEQALGDIASDRTISEELKSAYASIVGGQYDKMIQDAKRKKADSLLALKKEKESTTKTYGAAILRNVKDVIQGKSTTIEKGASTLLLLIENPVGLREEFNEKHNFDPKTKAAFLGRNYPRLSQSDAASAAVLNFKWMIADLNMEREESSYDLESILVHAGKVFGVDSDEYADIASFARYNLSVEKNNRTLEAKNFMLENVYKGDKSKWEENASSEERAKAVRIMSLLSEVPDGQYAELADRLAIHISIDDKFDFVLRANALREMVYDAQTSKDGASAFPEAVERPGLLQVDIDAEAAVLEAEIEAAKSGRRFLEHDRERAEHEYWVKKANELKIFGPKTNIDIYDYDGGELEALVHTALLTRKKVEEGKKRDAAERPGLEAEFEKLNLPLNRGAYTSFMGIGGYPIDNINELELGTNLSGAEKLTVNEMKEVLRQYRYYIDKRAASKTAKEEHIKSLEEKLARLKNTKTGE